MASTKLWQPVAVAAFLTFAAPFLAGSFSLGQDDSVRQEAIEQMRQIANAMKQCPERKTKVLMPYESDECQNHYSYIGPPTNVEWDVVPSKTARSPFQGIIEFVLPGRMEHLIKTDLSQKQRQQCEKKMQSLPLGAAYKEKRDFHYRYEFDLGSGPPELVKTLSVWKDENNNIETESVSLGDACWVSVAKSGGSPGNQFATAPSGSSGSPSVAATATPVSVANSSLSSLTGEERFTWQWYLTLPKDDREYIDAFCPSNPAGKALLPRAKVTAGQPAERALYCQPWLGAKSKLK